MRRLLMLLLLTTGALAQSTTTVTGTVKDLSAAVVTSGQITFDLRPGLDTTISGAARFVPSTVICTINGSGLIKALDGVSACIVTQNTSLTPNGTYYKVCIQAYSITPGSCFNWYALASTFDITTAVPTPATAPAFTFLDLITTQTISGVKTFTAVPVFSAGISGTLGQTLALPALADTLVGRTTTDTLTNKTLTSPVINTPTITSATMVTPALGAATGTSLVLSGGLNAASAAFSGSLTSTSPSAGLGYAAGAGCNVTQITNKSTGVICTGMSGVVTMNNAALGGTTSVGFTVTNTSVLPSDAIIVSIRSGATVDSYTATVDTVGTGSFRISLRNYTGGGLSEAIVINFAILRAANS